jgi:L-fuculose-phosphate aldolase
MSLDRVRLFIMNGKPPESASAPAAIAKAMGHIYRRGMTTISGGNISVRDDGGDIWITPAQIDKGRLRPSDIVRVTADGRVAGRHAASSEYPAHRLIFRERDDLRAIIHAHPAGLVVFSICHKTPDTAILPAVHDLCGEVGYAPYERSGSEALGRQVAAAFAGACNCLVLENHGVVVGGADLRQALARFEALEQTARTIIRAAALGPIRRLDAVQLDRARASAAVLADCEAPSPAEREESLRKEICRFARRAYRQSLTISGGGGMSGRLDGRAFLITSLDADWRTIEPDDLVPVVGWTCPAGRRPDRAVLVHEAIYRRHPRVAAIITAAAPSTAAFSVTGAHLDSRATGEGYFFLGDVATISFDAFHGQADHLAAAVGPDRPAWLVENEGALVLGTSVLSAYDRLEVLESTAEALIGGRSVGGAVPLQPRAIEELGGPSSPIA